MRREGEKNVIMKESEKKKRTTHENMKIYTNHPQGQK